MVNLVSTLVASPPPRRANLRFNDGMVDSDDFPASPVDYYHKHEPYISFYYYAIIFLKHIRIHIFLMNYDHHTQPFVDSCMTQLPVA